MESQGASEDIFKGFGGSLPKSNMTSKLVYFFVLNPRDSTALISSTREGVILGLQMEKGRRQERLGKGKKGEKDFLKKSTSSLEKSAKEEEAYICRMRDYLLGQQGAQVG